MTETPVDRSDPVRHPTTEEALAALDMPLVDAMQTQRAVRRLHTDPVDDALLLRLLELSLKAPTSSNTQDWSYVVVKDRQQKARIARLYGVLYRAFKPFAERAALADPAVERQLAPQRWQAENFEEIPVLVIPCYRRTLKHAPVGFPQISVSSYYGSVYPAVQNLLLACRAVGLGASLQTLPIWLVPVAKRILGLPWNLNPVCIIPIGWAKGNYGPTKRRPIGEVVHVDRFGNRPFAGGE
ncbi:MAG: nitroreductase family protein [Acidimicrobiia bacterium]|nr:nitroreductase family protein [Acidimicrobiia bacterium]